MNLALETGPCNLPVFAGTRLPVGYAVTLFAQGESLFVLSERYGVPVTALEEALRLTNARNRHQWEGGDPKTARRLFQLEGRSWCLQCRRERGPCECEE